MKARLGWLVAVAGAGAIALSAAAQGSAKLAVGPDAGGYLCPDGRKIWVSRCYDQSAQASCQVVHLHVKNNGLNPETASTRTELLAGLKNCVLTPLEFTNSGVNLLPPKSALPQQTAKAPAASPVPKASTATPSQTSGDALDLSVPDGMAFGYTNVRSSLVRISPADATSPIFYVDEASRKVTAQKDVTTIWSLTAYADGKPPVAGVAAMWVEYQVNCKQSSFELTLYFSLDRQAKMLKISVGDVSGKLTKGSVAEVVAGIACKPAPPFNGPRFPSAKAAIADAFAGAAPKTAAKPAVPAAQPNAAAQARLDLLEEAESHFAFDEYELAIPLYERAMELDPKDVETAEQICTLYVLSDAPPEKGVIACERLLKLKPKNLAFPHQAIAELQMRKGDNQTALTSALEWARLEPQRALPRTTLAKIYVALGRNRDALAQMQEAAKLQPKDITTLAPATVPPATAQKPPAPAATTPAPSAAQPAAKPKVWPKPDPRSHLGKGIALYRDLDFQPALVELLAATKADPTDARAFAFLSDTYRWLSVHDEEQKARQKALALDPNAFDALR